MEKLDLNDNIYEIVRKFPSLRNVIQALGLIDISTDIKLQTYGRLSTIPSAARAKNIDMKEVLKALGENGFEAEEPEILNETEEDRAAVLKQIIDMLEDGGHNEEAKELFHRHFYTVNAFEVSKAEQILLKGGVSKEEVSMLCDIHASMAEKPEKGLKDIPDHPLNIMCRENEEMQKRLDQIKDVPYTKENAKKLSEFLSSLKAIRPHYARKEELFFPALERHQVKGPQNVMWEKDSEIYREISIMAAAIGNDDPSFFEKRVKSALEEAEKMIQKENTVLYPMCQELFDDHDWAVIYRDMDEMGPYLVENNHAWKPAETAVIHETASSAGAVVLPTGSLTAPQIEAILRTIPLDMTFIDENDIVRFFTNNGNRLFPRPLSCIGNEVCKCHAPNIIPIVKQLLESFKSGAADRKEIWIDKPDRLILVRYIAVRDPDGKYMGTIETSTDMKPYAERITHAQMLRKE